MLLKKQESIKEVLMLMLEMQELLLVPNHSLYAKKIGPALIGVGVLVEARYLCVLIANIVELLI